MAPETTGTGATRRRRRHGAGSARGKRIVLDPVTRVEGHLRVEIEVENGVVKDAWVSGGLYRGMEAVLEGREPADAFYVAQRICGVCPVPHGHAATMAAESALGIKIPNNARIIRNLIEGAETLHSHILWFYTLAALDYVDVTSALTADVAQDVRGRARPPARASRTSARPGAAEGVRRRRAAVDLHGRLVGTSRRTSCRPS